MRVPYKNNLGSVISFMLPKFFYYHSMADMPCDVSHSLQREKWWLPNHPPRFADSGEG